VVWYYITWPIAQQVFGRPRAPGLPAAGIATRFEGCGHL
jgi:hypothetical protein